MRFESKIKIKKKNKKIETRNKDTKPQPQKKIYNKRKNGSGLTGFK